MLEVAGRWLKHVREELVPLALGMDQNRLYRHAGKHDLLNPTV